MSWHYFDFAQAVMAASLPSTHKTVLWAIGLRANHRTGQCYPGYEQLARDTGLSRRTVAKVVPELLDGPFLSARQAHGRVNVYRCATIPPVRRLHPSPVQQVQNPVQNGCQTSAPAAPELPRELPRSLSRAPARPRVKDTRLPEDWTLPAELATWAQSQGLTSDEVASEAERFRDYYLGRGAVRADWGATWRSWVRRRDEFKRSPPKKREQRPDVNPLADYEAQIAAERGPRKGGPTPEQLASFDIEAARRKLHAELGLPMQAGAA